MHIKQSHQWGNYLKSLGWESLYIPQAIRIKPLLFWSAIKIQRPSQISEEFLNKVDKIAREKRALFTIIEPKTCENENIFPKHRYRPYKEPLSFTKTIVVDLKPSLETLLKSFSKDTRQKIKRETEFKIGLNPILVEEFYKLFAQTAKRKKFWIPPLLEIKTKISSFGGDVFVVTAFYKKTPTAVALILIHEKTAYYEHAAHNPTTNKDAPYNILWETIKECKKRNLRTLDLCGIYDTRFSKATKKWEKFTIFKKKWGGSVLTYPTPYIKYYPRNFIPFRYS